MTREEAIEILTHNWTRVDNPNYSESELDEAVDMAIEALQTEHGKWKEKETYLNEGDCEITEWQSARCSKCGKYHTTPYMYSFNNFNFCPNCGAKMDKEEEE